MYFSERQRRLLRILWVVLAVSVIIGSLLPGSSLPMRLLGRLPLNDKVEHFAAYAVLALIPALHESRRTVLQFLAGVFVLGVLLEFGQLFSAGRFFELADMAANGSGALCGLAVGRLLRL